MILKLSTHRKEFQCVCVILLNFLYSEAKTFSVCDLGVALCSRGLRDTADWICRIESASGWKTDAISAPHPDGSRDYGLFQINSHWCNQRKRGCDLPCRSLIDDNIDDDVACAKTIVGAQGQGFPVAWHGLKAKCTGDLSPYECYHETHDGPDGPDGRGCDNKGGQCKNKNECSNSLQKIDGQWSCPNDPDDVWCCPGNGSHPLTIGGDSLCVKKGGQCKNKTECSNPQDKINGQWSCPDDPDYVWCCMSGVDDSGQVVHSSPCVRHGGHCTNRFQCSGTALEKINGTWSCPDDLGDIWCCK